jgi:hypothetical protein
MENGDKIDLENLRSTYSARKTSLNRKGDRDYLT